MKRHVQLYSSLGIDLKKKFDMIPAIVEAVKSYAGHEKSTLEEVIKMWESVSPRPKVLRIAWQFWDARKAVAFLRRRGLKRDAF